MCVPGVLGDNPERLTNTQNVYINLVFPCHILFMACILLTVLLFYYKNVYYPHTFSIGALGAGLSTRAPVACLRDMEALGSDELQCPWARAETDLLLSAREPSKLLSLLWSHLFSTRESIQTSRRRGTGAMVPEPVRTRLHLWRVLFPHISHQTRR